MQNGRGPDLGGQEQSRFTHLGPDSSGVVVNDSILHYEDAYEGLDLSNSI